MTDDLVRLGSSPPEAEAVQPGPPSAATVHTDATASGGSTVVQAGRDAFHLRVELPVPPAITTFSLRAPSATFVGREERVASIVEMVERAGGAEQAQAIIAIDGMPGVGKTELALHLAHRLAPLFNDRVLQVDLHGHTPGRLPALPRDVLVELLSGDGMSGQYLPTNLDALAALWRSRMAGKRVLLLLDNAWDEAQVERLLPGAPGHVVLVTSRRRLIGLRERHSATIVPLDVLSEAEAVALLTKVARHAVPGSEMETVNALVRDCGYLPLQICVLAARFDPESGDTWADLLAEFTKARSGASGPSARGEASRSSVDAAFALSYGRLPETRRLVFRRLGLVPGDDIDPYAAAALTGLPVDVTEGELWALHVEHRLLDRFRNRYRMHDLVRAYARRLAEKDGATECVAATHRLLSFYQHTASRVDVQFSRQLRPEAVTVPEPATRREFAGRRDEAEWLRAELPNILACIAWAEREAPYPWLIGFAAAIQAFLRNDGLWDQAIELQTRALAASRAAGNPLAEANTLAELGLLRRLKGDFDGAVSNLRQAIERYGALGEQRGAAQALNDLGVALDASGQHPSAKRDLERALREFRALHDQLGEANVLNDLGIAERFAGNFDAAARLLHDALVLYRALGNRLGEAHAQTYLATVQARQGHFQEATEHLQGAETIYRELGNRLGEANAITELGNVLRLRREYQRSTALFAQALGLHRELGNLRGEGNACAGLGRCARDQGNELEAAGWFRSALAILEVIGVPEAATVAAELAELEQSP